MAVPDFLCIGAQKAGTTWLNKMFESHPKIWTPPVKELQYFNELYMPDAFKWTKQHRSSHGEKAKFWTTQNLAAEQENLKLCELIATGDISKSWYEKIFDYAPSQSVKGEMTPEYSLLSELYARKITEQYPNIKIIFVMRDPFERALSGIKMRLLQQGFDENSSQDSIDEFVVNCAEDWDVIERGNYQKIISNWTQATGKGNFLGMLSNDFLNNPEKALVSIAEFLKVDKLGFKGNRKEKIHVGKSYKISSDAIDAVRKLQENIEWFENNYKKYVCA